jgi:hypothetical protein
MKYIISESRLDSIMTEYLDSFFLNKEISDNEVAIMVYDNDDEDYFQYFHKKKELFILDEFLDEFETMFGLGRTKSLKFISEWFESEFQVDVRKVG